MEMNTYKEDSMSPDHPIETKTYVTARVSVIDSHKIDLLVAAGHFTNRSDALREAIRDLIRSHAE